MDGQQLVDFLELVVRGYTIKRLRQLMLVRGWNLEKVPDAYLISLMRQGDAVVEQARNDLDARTRKDFGLAQKLERVRRLCEAAEAIEDFASESTRWSAEYRRYLAQIQDELEPLGLTVEIGDSWAALLMDLAEIGNVDESDSDSEGEGPSGA